MAAASNPKINFRVFNIVIRYTQKVTPESYEALFNRLFKERIWEKVSREVAVMLRSQFTQAVGNNQVLYGKIVRYVSLDGAPWFDRTNLEETEISIPEEIFPSLRQSDYVFVPTAHRFALITNTDGVTPTNAQKFLEKVLNRVASPGDEVYVNIEQDTDTFESIIDAAQIKRLVITVSYSNNDTNDEATEFMDDDLRAGGVGKIQIAATPDASGDIRVNDSTVLKGALGVAKSNGNALARIVTPSGEKKQVSTTNYPLKLSVRGNTEGDGPFAVFAKIMSYFRGNQESQTPSTDGPASTE